MVELDFNELVDRAQVYDSFIQLKSGLDFYKFLSLQSVEAAFVWPMLDRVGTDATLVLTPDISQHIHTQEIVLTTTEVDVTHPPENTRTISYYIHQKELRKNVVASVVTTFEATTTEDVNPIMKLSYDYEVLTISNIRTNGEGEVIVTTTGRIIPGTIQFIRSAS